MFDRSPLIHNMLTNEASDFTFEVNEKKYNRYYLSADGIYPQWSCFIQSIHKHGDEKRKHFVKRQEACRKDIKHCFGVLLVHFNIIQNQCPQWSMDTISDIMFAYCIFHNMILDDERDVPGLENIISGLVDDNVPLRRGFSFEALMNHTVEIENEDLHYSLRGDLIKYLWAFKGTNIQT